MQQQQAYNQENHIKSTAHRQWREKPIRPIIAREMSEEEIQQLQITFARSYGCPPEDILIDFARIEDDNDIDQLDCIWLILRMVCFGAPSTASATALPRGKSTTREIFKIKVRVPERLKQRAAASAQPRKGVLALPAPAPASTAKPASSVNIGATATAPAKPPVVKPPVVKPPVAKPPVAKPPVGPAAPRVVSARGSTAKKTN